MIRSSIRVVPGRQRVALAARLAAAYFLLHGALACDPTTPTDGADLGSGGAVPGSGGATGSGGAPPSGGAPASGGQPSGGAPGSGGAATGGVGGGSGGALASGGAASGGAPSSGGASSGGASSGGSGGTEAFTPCPPAGSPCVILPLGDSITEGFASSGGGYRVELFRQALEQDKSITFVGAANPNGPSEVDGTPFPRNHEGHGGFTIDTDSGHSGISGSITNDALDDFSPHIVLLMIGTNDINGNVDVANAPQRLGNLIDDITERSPDTLVVVASVAPVKDDGTNAKMVQYNMGVEQVASERAADGAHVIFVDNYAAIHDVADWKNALMADNLHPNDAGYDAFGQSFFDAISSYLP